MSPVYCIKSLLWEKCGQHQWKRDSDHNSDKVDKLTKQRCTRRRLLRGTITQIMRRQFITFLKNKCRNLTAPTDYTRTSNGTVQ